MSLQPHEYRVLDEREDLAGKVDRLYEFTGSQRFRTLPIAEQSRLVRQLNHMRGYLGVLDERIAAFT